MSQGRYSIAIDGPAGAGKSTIAKKLAQRFGLQYVDTGAMYRGVALLALRRGIAVDDAAELGRLALEMKFRFRAELSGEDLVNRVFLNEEDVTEAIRTPEISRTASPVSAVSEVRRALVAKQQEIGAEGGVVMEGRDIGTVVLPEAEVKIFLTASLEERARRRHKELVAKGMEEPFEKVLAEIMERDNRDMTRSDSPLVAAPDAENVDTDRMSIDEVVDEIAKIFQKIKSNASSRKS